MNKLKELEKITNKYWLVILLAASLACNLPITTEGPVEAPQASEMSILSSTIESSAEPLPTIPPTRSPDDLPPSPSPDSNNLPASESLDSIHYTVQLYDTLGTIAEQFGLKWEDLANFNNIANPNQLEIGQLINIPSIQSADFGPDFKIIPNSELPYGPAAVYLDIEAFAKSQSGFLSVHRDRADGIMLDGTEIVEKVAREYSVNPKILLTLLELQSGWVRDDNPRTSTLEFPLNYQDIRRIGLYAQLAWAADILNEGYYQWKLGQNTGWFTKDSVFISASPSINAGTAAIQNVLANLYDEDQWRSKISEEGFFATYQLLFGYPFDFALEPQFPADLEQPLMQLPFENDVPWVFSGGPHSGWGNYSAWAALDFAPRGEQLGCLQSADWVVAAANGLVVRSEDGAVVQDLDGDGNEQSGWTILYMHVAEYERVAEGEYLQAGDRIGHPSCEGGLASASHLHLARRYDGEWIPASGDYPLVMDSWVSVGTGSIYDGFLKRDGLSIEACECYDPALMLQR